MAASVVRPVGSPDGIATRGAAAVWLPVASLPAAAAVGGRSLPGGERMVLMAAALFLGFKVATLPRGVGWGRAFLYVGFWPGLDPAPFEGRAGRESRGPVRVPPALAEVGVGALLVGAALWPAVPPAARPWLAIAGALCAVHLGIFDLLAAAWRRAGVPVERLCPDPWRAASLAEFWGARWNRAFGDFARGRVCRPVARRWGGGAGVAATFLFSGLAHELVISWPARGGYGLPTVYFALHGLLVLLEKRGVRPASRALTAAVMLVPLPLLFHAEFMERVVMPWLEGMPQA